MTKSSTFTNAVKTLLITGFCYGWFLPVSIVGEMIQKAYPTANITDQWEVTETEANVPTSSTYFEVVTEASAPIEQEAVKEEVASPEPTTKPTTTVKREQPVAHATPKPVKQTVPSTSSQDTLGNQTRPKLTRINTLRPLKRSPLTTSNQRKARKKCTPVDYSDDIQALGPHQYQLSKKMVREYRRDWNSAQKLARLSWYQPSDQRLGIKIRGISCKSPVRFGGLKAGDVVVSVNGKSLTSEKDLLAVYGRLLIWKDIELKILRRGRPMSLQYQIR